MFSRTHLIKVWRFLLGIIIGISFALMTVAFLAGDVSQSSPFDEGHHVTNYSKWPHHLIYDTMDPIAKIDLYQVNKKKAQELVQNVRVMCIFYKSKTKHFVNQLQTATKAWAEKCTTVLLFIDEHHKSLPAVSFDRPPLWLKRSQSKFIMALRYVFVRHFHEADWFFIAQGIPYVIMENLRHFLSTKDQNEAAYFGHRLKHKTLNSSFVDHLAGVVLSKKALHQVGTRGDNEQMCDVASEGGGMMFSLCMNNIGVRLGDSVDDKNRSRFLMYNLGSYLENNVKEAKWFRDQELDSKKSHLSVSPSLISLGRSPVMDYPGYSFTLSKLLTINNTPD